MGLRTGDDIEMWEAMTTKKKRILCIAHAGAALQVRFLQSVGK